MAVSRVELRGERELARGLSGASSKLANLREAHEEAGRLVRPVAANRTPVRSGALRASLKNTADAKAATISAGNSVVPYARPIHWGWPSRNIRRNAFLWDAIKSTESRWIQVYEKAVNGLLRKIKGA